MDLIYIALLFLLLVITVICIRYIYYLPANGTIYYGRHIETSGGYDTITEKTKTYLGKFINDVYSKELLKNIADLYHDLEYPLPSKASTEDEQSKVLLFILLGYYIYDKNPTNYVRSQLENAIKILEARENESSFSSTWAEFKRLKKLTRELFDLKKSDENKLDTPLANEWYIYANAIHYTATSIDKKELSVKNIEIRKLQDEINRLRIKADVSIDSTTDYAICIRERRELTERVSELRRQLEQYKYKNTSTCDCSSMQSEISRLNRALSNCEQVLNDVLNTS